MKSKQLQSVIAFCINAHSKHPTNPSKAVRLFDRRTPYAVHPMCAAMLLLQEPGIPYIMREVGAHALLLHDIPEDTRLQLPPNTPDSVAELVRDMTFLNSDAEMVEIWNKPPDVKLLKLYDKVSNLFDASWMDSQKRRRYEEYTLKLCEAVEQAFGMLYGTLNIIRIARAICTNVQADQIPAQ